MKDKKDTYVKVREKDLNEGLYYLIQYYESKQSLMEFGPEGIEVYIQPQADAIKRCILTLERSTKS